MSTDTSVPQPRLSGLDVSDSALLATLLREAPIGFAFFGPDLRFRRINRALAGLDGLDLDAHVGLLPSQVWPATLAARAESAVRHVLAEGQPLFESNLPVSVGTAAPGDVNGRPSGDAGDGPGDGTAQDDRHWAFSWFPSHDPDGNIAGVALIAVDVTDRRSSAEAVRRSEERYRSLVQAGAQVVWVTTPDRPDRRGFARVALDHRPEPGGVPRQWLAGRDPPGRPRAGGARMAGMRPAPGKVFDSRYRVRTKTGSYRHYDVRAVPIERDGKIIEWVGASTDVTGAA